MKIIFFDTETTGLDAKIHGMHQLAGEIVIDGKVADKFDYRVRPFKGCEIDPEALKVSNTDVLAFRSKYNQEFQVQYMLYNLLEKHLNYKNQNDKFFLAGWRVEFDVRFLEAFYSRNTQSDLFKSYFWSNPIDIKTLATQYLLEKRPEMPHFHLVDVAKYLGIEVNESKLHSAAYDAYLCRMVYDYLPKCTLGTTDKSKKQ